MDPVPFGCTEYLKLFKYYVQTSISEHKAEMALELIEQKLDVHTKDYFGKTALHYAASSIPNPVIITRLLEKGANLEAADNEGRTSLHCAVTRSAFGGTGIKLLLDKGANIEAMTFIGDSPLHCATKSNQLDTVKLLIERGSNIEAVNKDGDTPLLCALYRGIDEEIVCLLLEIGANVHVTNISGYSVLHFAANYCDHVEIVESLLERGAFRLAADLKGMTASQLYESQILWRFCRGPIISNYLKQHAAWFQRKSYLQFVHQTFPNNPSVTDGIDGVETGMESVRALNMEADNKGLLAQHVMGDHHFVRLIGEYL